MSAADTVLELRGVSRAFGAVQAVKDASLAIARGTVHAVVGENGAGKSTLMKLAYGELRADAGDVVIKGDAVARNRHSPARAIAAGVGMVHQHFMLVGPMTVAENLVIGREPTRGPWLDLGRAARELRALAGRYGLDVDPDATIENLSVGEQQRVEILKVLWQGCDVLILDEPTAVLTPGEVRALFEVLRGLVDGGMSVVLITHKLDEVCAIADRITVMRRGEVVAELDGAGASPEAIARAMVGRPVLLEVERTAASPGEVVLAVDGLRVARAGGGDAVAGLSLEVRAGEIVGIAGVEGNGQSELALAIAGLRQPLAGRIRLAGGDLAHASVRARQAAGLAHVPEDRQARGLVLDFDVTDNLWLGRQREVAGRFGLDRGAMRQAAERVIAEGDIRPADPAALARGLSGGNQQKIVIHRELGRPAARLLLCVQPTRGVDIGAIEDIHRRIVAARDRGLAVLLISADLGELTALSDRIAVMVRGGISAELVGAELGGADLHERLGELMTGAKRDGART